MQKIEIKPNDSTYIGKTFVSGTVSCVLLDVGSEYVIRSAINISDPFDRRVVSIHDFNDCWALEEPKLETNRTARVATERVDWSKVKWARNRFSGAISRVHSGKVREADSAMGFFDCEKNMDHYEPIKFTQTLKVGDLIKAKNEHFQWEVKSFHPDNGFTVRLIQSGHPDFIRYMDVHFVHSDDWELVNDSAGWGSQNYEERLQQAAKIIPKEDLEYLRDRMEEPKIKPLRLAPALFCEESTWVESSVLFSSKKEAEEEYLGAKVIWPAIPNKDGFYEVPEVEDDANN